MQQRRCDERSEEFSCKKFSFGWIIIVLCAVSAGFINLQFPSFINHSFENKDFIFLNKLAHTEGELAKEYYQGRIEDRIVGPVTNLLSFLILIIICLLQKKEISFLKFTFLIFIFLAISKFNILFYPPYGDAVGGPFAEALWLKDHHFDYVGLFHQPGYLEGGPKVYFFTIYPTYLAILYTLIPNVQVFLMVNHLLVYAMAAVIAAFSREILMKSLDNLSATLGSLVILAMPLFQSQTEAINMEMPQLFFSALSVRALVRRDIFKASLWAILALSVKGHGVIICTTVFLVSVYLFLTDVKKKFDWRILLMGMGVLILAFLNVASKYLLKDQHVSQGMVKLFVGWASLKTMCLPALLGGSVGLLGIYLLSELWTVNSGQRKKIYSQFTVHSSLYTQAVILLICTMWFVLFLNFQAVSPRYKLALQPFLVISIIFSLTNFAFLKQWAKPLFVIAIAIISLGSFGKYYPSLQANYHVLSERSLEYRNNVKLDVNVCRFIEDHFHSFTIGAPFIYAQMLNIPELGYVKESLNVVQYGLPVHYRTIKPFEGLNNLDIMKTIWVGVAADFNTHEKLTYPIHAQDKILKEFMVGDNKATLFMGGFAIDQRWKMVQQFLILQQLNKK